LHYVIKIKKHHTGARYDDLKGLLSEIQIRTILQDAWAVVAHHLSYKHESDIPKELRRKLNALAGLFETADDQFQNIKVARSHYQDRIKHDISQNKDMSLDQNVNLDNLLAYMSWKFPDRKPSSREDAADLLFELHQFDYKKLRDVDNVVERAWRAVLEAEKKDPPQEIDSNIATQYVGVGLIRSALAFVNEKYLVESGRVKHVKEFGHLVKSISS